VAVVAEQCNAVVVVEPLLILRLLGSGCAVQVLFRKHLPRLSKQQLH
jgi:hypothetical protein